VPGFAVHDELEIPPGELHVKLGGGSGGHNGLTAAAYLAGAGKSVLVLEQRDQLGGACTLEQPFRDPRFVMSPCAYLVGLLHPLVVEELDLVATPAQPVDEASRLPVRALVDAAVEGQHAHPLRGRHGVTCAGAPSAADGSNRARWRATAGSAAGTGMIRFVSPGMATCS